MAALTAAMTALALASTISTVKQLSTKSPKTPQVPVIPNPPKPPDLTDAVTAAGNKQRRLSTSSYGRSSTLLTGPSGSGDKGAPIMRKTLLGL